MMIRSQSSSKFVVVIICLCPASKNGFGQQFAEERSTLGRVRQASPETFTMEVEVERPVHALMPGQGRVTRVMRVTVGEDMTAMVWKAIQLPVAKYFPPDTGGYQAGDYDADGNLIVPMLSEGASLRDKSENEEYSEGCGFRVAPNGTATRLNSGSFLNRHHPSATNTESFGVLCRVLWALGRPWKDGLKMVVYEEVNPDGFTRLGVDGDWVPGSGSAICELSVEPGNGHLVRRASFGVLGEPPRAECRSEGIRRFSGIVLADRGEFTVQGVETIAVRLISFKSELDPGVVAVVRKVIGRVQTRPVQLLDYRDDPHQPKVRLVPAGDLDKQEQKP